MLDHVLNEINKLYKTFTLPLPKDYEVFDSIINMVKYVFNPNSIFIEKEKS